MTRPWRRHRRRALPRRLALRWPRAHAPHPVRVIGVADDKRERRAERAAVSQAREDFDLVRLDLLARAASVALLAAPQVGVDGAAVEDEARGEPRHDGDERRAVGLTRGDEAERHGPTRA